MTVPNPDARKDAKSLAKKARKGHAEARRRREADLFVEGYLKALIEQPANAGLREQVSWPPAARGSWRSQQPDQDFLVAVSWNMDKERPYRSHIVQLVNLSLPAPPEGEAPLPVFAVIFDSSQYSSQPILLPSFNAGVNGSILPDQIATVEAWLSEGPENRLNFLMSHHPYSTLYKDARQAIDDFRRRYKVPLYNSAHTHRGEWMVNQSDENLAGAEPGIGAGLAHRVPGCKAGDELGTVQWKDNSRSPIVCPAECRGTVSEVNRNITYEVLARVPQWLLRLQA
ncbi:MAG: hypothetical protein V3T83_07630 [Acidobacteriota bacterium]